MIELESFPTLVDPVLVAAFEGWNDAGDAASDTVAHLIEVWDATPLVDLDSEEYYDYQVSRPQISMDAGGIRSLTWPATRIYVARVPLFPRDIVLLQVSLVITLGALLSDIPHTRPVPVTATSTEAELQQRYDLEPSTYEGPTGIVGALQEACGRFEIPAMSLWAAVPHYVSAPPCPKATLALVSRLEDILDMPVPLGELVEEARAWELGVDDLAAEDEEVADYVRQLEEARDATDLPEASGEAIAKEFERYLRRRGSDET